jgi:CHASE3 domain sensor protein
MSAESITLTILASLALGLLVVVTGGVAFLTTMEWRDRRRQDQEKRDLRRRK